jgi:hypothetical protein
MNKNKYKEYFGLYEQDEKKLIPNKDEIEDTTQAVQDLGSAMKDAGLIDEAELINKMRDYRGGVEYVIYDPSLAQAVQNNIEAWATKKGFNIIKKETSPSGKVGYFYFRLGEDQFTEAKKIQGYISQLAQIKHFRFNIKQKTQKINKPLK